MTSFNLKFLGAASTVTGSKTILEIDGVTLLVDSGLYQGTKILEELNKKEFSVPPGIIDAIFITHGHLDHCGYLPVLVQQGFLGDIYTTAASKRIIKIVLSDAAHIQLENFKEGRIDALLYNQEDVDNTLSLIKTVDKDTTYSFKTGEFSFIEAGHILGASSIVFEFRGKRICFSGDLGRKNDPLHPGPAIPSNIDYLVLESTYGDRDHRHENFEKILKHEITRMKETKGVLLIPAFAVARTQILLYDLYCLFKKFPKLRLPIYVDSPMGVKATHLYEEFKKELRNEIYDFDDVLKIARLVEFGNDVKKLAKAKAPFILISSSGMLTGGKVIKYLEMYAKHEKNTILLAGHQGEETLGRKLLDGEKLIRLKGHDVEVRAKIDLIQSLSAHAGQSDLLEYVANMKDSVKRVFLNHGESSSSHNLQEELTKMNIQAVVVEKEQDYPLEEN